MTDDLPGERWRLIAGFEDVYEVSDLGRVRSLARTIEITSPRSRPYLVNIRERILKPSVTDGYPVVTLWLAHCRTHTHVAKLVAEAFLGECPQHHEVMQRNGRRQDASLANLVYATRDRIEEGKRERGSLIFGEAISWAKLTEEDVRFIRANADCLSQEQMAASFATTQSRISRIVNRHQWKQVA